MVNRLSPLKLLKKSSARCKRESIDPSRRCDVPALRLLPDRSRSARALPECGQHFDRDKIATFDTSKTKAGDKLAVASIAVSIVCLIGLLPTVASVAGRWSTGAGNTLAWVFYLAVFGAAFVATCLGHAARKRLPLATRSTYREVAKLSLVIGYFCMGILCMLWGLAIIFSRGY